jgi:hypothetical protein
MEYKGGKRRVFEEDMVSVEKGVETFVIRVSNPFSMVYDGRVVLFISLTHLYTLSIFV